MANRSFNRKQALEKEIKEIYANISVGAVGAVTVVSPIGIASVSRTSAGLVRIILQDKYIELKHVAVTLVAAAAENIAFQVVASDVSGAIPYIDVLCTAEGVAVDASSGASLLVKMELKNSSAK